MLGDDLVMCWVSGKMESYTRKGTLYAELVDELAKAGFTQKAKTNKQN